MSKRNIKIGLSEKDKLNMKNEILEDVKEEVNDNFANLENEVRDDISEMHSTIQGLGNLEPSGTDTSTNILAFAENKGIYVATDTGGWYYWKQDVSKYVYGGVYQTDLRYDSLKNDLESANKINEFINRINNAKIQMVIGRFSNGWWITDNTSFFSTNYIDLYKGDKIVALNKLNYLFFDLIKLESRTAGSAQTKIASTFDEYTITEDGIYCLQGAFINQPSLTEELLTQATNEFNFYSYYSNFRSEINNLYSKVLLFSKNKLAEESNAECINRLLTLSSENNIPVIIDSVVEVNTPIYMKKKSTLKGLNSTKSEIKASSDFVGEAIIIIDTVNDSEVSNIGINGGSVYDWGTGYGFKSLGAETMGILVTSEEISTNVTYTRIKNVAIKNINGIGLRVTDVAYEGLYDGIEIKCCNERGAYIGATDSIFNNFIIGNCNDRVANASESFGASLEGGNNNYSNFKVYLSGTNAGVNIYNAGNNNYNNFNIQDCGYCGLYIRGNGAENCNFTNLVIDRCPIGIILQGSKLNFIQAQITWSKEEAPIYGLFRSAYNKGYNYINLISNQSSDKITLSDTYTIFGLMYKELNS